MRLATTLIVALTLTSSIAQAATTERARYLMGTVCEIATTPGHEAGIESAFAEASRIETLLSTWIEGSELSRVNRGESEPGPELRALLGEVVQWSARTGGAFDPRVKSLIDVWRTREDGALPDAHAIQAARCGASSSRCAFEEGAFGKGYAIDRMLARIDAPEAMIDFGGQVAVRGTLRVTIADPQDRSRPVAALILEDASISTSSGSEKTFEVGGRRFSHILDPRTGEALPPRGSVSVIAADALSADILSTALYVMGEDDGLRWADANGVSAVFITPSHRIRRSAAARERVRGLEAIDRNFTIKD